LEIRKKGWEEKRNFAWDVGVVEGYTRVTKEFRMILGRLGVIVGSSCRNLVFVKLRKYDSSLFP
jgi:hypothetical protein